MTSEIRPIYVYDISHMLITVLPQLLSKDFRSTLYKNSNQQKSAILLTKILSFGEHIC